MVRVDVKPELLRWARDRSGRPEEEFATKFPQLSDWEDRTRIPTMKQIQDFAAFSYAPLSLLFQSSPPREERPIADFRTLPGVNTDPFSPHLLDTIYRCEWQQEWYRDFQLSLSEDQVSFVGIATATDGPEEAATHLRNELGFDPVSQSNIHRWDQAARALQEVLDASGVLVMQSGIVANNTRRKLDPAEFRGFSLSDPIAPLVFINGRDTVAAQIFTTAHELGHLCRGETGLSNADIRSLRGAPEEQWCNNFAAEFLVPQLWLGQEFRSSVSISSEVRRLTQHFKVSSLVILRRLRDIGVLVDSEFQDMYRRESAIAQERASTRRSKKGEGGNFYYSLTKRLGRRFARSVVASVLEGQTPYTEGFALLGIKKNESFFKFARHLGFQV